MWCTLSFRTTDSALTVTAQSDIFASISTTFTSSRLISNRTTWTRCKTKSACQAVHIIGVAWNAGFNPALPE